MTGTLIAGPMDELDDATGCGSERWDLRFLRCFATSKGFCSSHTQVGAVARARKRVWVDVWRTALRSWERSVTTSGLAGIRIEFQKRKNYC